jgi:hypothetical protein
MSQDQAVLIPLDMKAVVGACRCNLDSPWQKYTLAKLGSEAGFLYAGPAFASPFFMRFSSLDRFAYRCKSGGHRNGGLVTGWD